jgi:hypothetical protein
MIEIEHQFCKKLRDETVSIARQLYCFEKNSDDHSVRKEFNKHSKYKWKLSNDGYHDRENIVKRGLFNFKPLVYDIDDEGSYSHLLGCNDNLEELKEAWRELQQFIANRKARVELAVNQAKWKLDG